MNDVYEMRAALRTAVPANRVLHSQLGLCLSTALLCLIAQTAQADPQHGAVMRFEFDGQLDLTFGSSGTVETDIPGGAREYYYAGAPTTVNTFNDRYIAAGERRDGTSSRLLLVRYVASSGALDTSWGSQGFVVNNISGFTDFSITAVAIDSSRRIVAIGNMSKKWSPNPPRRPIQCERRV